MSGFNRYDKTDLLPVDINASAGMPGMRCMFGIFNVSFSGTEIRTT